MLVLLPPSEGKTPAPDGAPPVDLDALTSPALTAHRVTVLDALAAASARPDAHEVLGTTPGLAEEVRRNTVLRSAPAGPAADVYTGVLYGAADAVDGIVRRIRAEWPGGGSPHAIGTGGLAGIVAPLSASLERVHPDLTLQGLRLAARHLGLCW